MVVTLIIIVFKWLKTAANTLVELKRKELRHKMAKQKSSNTSDENEQPPKSAGDKKDD